MDGTLPRGPAPSKKPFGFKNKHVKKQKKAAPKISSSITINDYAEGCITLGSVRSVEDDALYIDLPGGHRGILLFTEVNEYFLQQLQIAVEENKSSFNTLTEFFQIGSFIMAVVLSSGTNPVELSIRPALINTGLPIKENSLFYAAVQSKEDKGYKIDIGREGYTCFLPYTNSEGKKINLKIGQPVYVKIISLNEEAKIIRLDLVYTDFAFPTVPESAPQFDEIRPFSVIDSVVKNNPPSGALKLLVGGVFNGVCSKFSWPAGLNQGDSVRARPLLIDPAQKLLWMSTIPTIVEGKRPNCFDVKLGEIVDTEVVRIRSGVGIECSLNQNGKDIRVFIDLATTEAENTIAAGETHTVRIIERRPIDDLLFAADDSETLSLQVFSVEDAEVGKEYDGVVTQVHPKYGVFVKISKFLTGLAPLAYCDNVDKLQKGSEVKAIVLSKENGQLRLALKEKLINSHYLRILTLDDARELVKNRERYEEIKPETKEETPNDEIDVLSNEPAKQKREETEEVKRIRKSQYTHVIVKKVVKSGMIVEMYNGLVAMIPAQYLPVQAGSDVSKIYQVGHVLRARVVTVDEDKINCSVTATDEKILQLGLKLKVKVIGFTNDAVQVQLPSQYGQFKAVVPNTHFSDNLNLSQRIRNTLSTGKKMICVLVRLPGFSAPAVLTRKQCFKQNFETIPRSNLEISPNTTYFGYVSGTQSFGSFISFFGRASGLIHNQKLKVGESVNAFVEKVDKGTVALTLPPEYGESELYLKNILFDINHNFAPPSEFTYDESSENSSLYFTVTEPGQPLDEQFIYDVNSEWKAISPINATIGSKLQVAYCDFISNVAILDQFVEGILEIEAGQTIEAIVLAVLEPIIVCKYNNHIFLAPTNNYNNHQDYSNLVKTGQTISLIVSEPYNNKINTATPSYLLNKEELNNVKAEILKIGDSLANIQLSDGRKGKIHLSQLSSEAKEGDIIQGHLLSGNKSLYMVTDPFSPQKQEDFKKGMKVVGFVTKVFPDFLQLSLSPFTMGTIHAMELTTSDRRLISRPLQENFSKGDRIEGYVEDNGENNNGNNSFVLISASNPLENNHVHFAKILHIKPGDYAEVVIGMNDRRILDVYEVSDEFKFNPLRQFKEGQVIDVAFIPGDKKYISTRESAFEGNFPKVEIEEGKILKGYVCHHSDKDKFILVRLARGVTGKLPRSKIADTYIKNPSELFPDGSVITVKIESITGEDQKIINLTSARSEIDGKLLTFEDLKVGDILDGYISGVNKSGVFVTLMDFHKLSGLVHRSNLEGHDPTEWQAFINSRVKVQVDEIDSEKKRINLKLVELIEKENQNSSSSSSSENEGENEEDNEIGSIQMNEIDLDFDENQEPDEDTEIVQRKMKLTEDDIAKLEAQQLKPTAPKTKAEFSRMLQAAPESSYLWVKFIEFHFANGDIDEAKRTAERALERIPTGDKQEKINVFISYINLLVLTAKKENFLDELTPLVDKAASSTDKIKIWSHFGVFVSAQRPEFEEPVWKLALKRCKDSVEIWNKYLETLMNEGKSDLARKEKKRGFEKFEDMQSEDRWKLIERFGIVEFRNGNIEHGRSVFEELIKNKQNNFDFWNIYIDMETKYGDVDHARAIYDRLAHTDLKSSRMRAILKKWLTFESTHGDDPTRKAYIKQIAVEYSAKSME